MDKHFVPFLGKEVKLGKAPARVDDRIPKLAKYKTAASLPTPPASVALATHIPSFPMLANDEFGDCTCAAVAHMEQVWTHDHYIPSRTETLDFYWMTGNVPPCPPGGPGDTGRVEIDVLNAWHNNGFGVAHHKIAGYASVNTLDIAEVKQALWLFGGLYIGIALPLTAQTQTKWTVVPDAGAAGEPGGWGGHAVSITAFTPYGLTCVTWGARMFMSWGFWHKYVDEAYAVLSPEWVNPNGTIKSPTGFDFSQLTTDLEEIS